MKYHIKHLVYCLEHKKITLDDDDGDDYPCGRVTWFELCFQKNNPETNWRINEKLKTEDWMRKLEAYLNKIWWTKEDINVHSQLCPTLCDTMYCNLPGLSICGNFPGKNTRVGCHFLCWIHKRFFFFFLNEKWLEGVLGKRE